MKQHPIPHNVLDIEFKLFGKFTAKEFVYIAIGVGIGWIFLMMRSNRQIPDIIAWPVFFISSGLGLFFGIANVNDQKADVFLGNYIMAITKPTRRIWKNTQFDEQLESIAQERGIVMTKGVMDRNANTNKPGTPSIAGGVDSGVIKNQFIPQQNLVQLDEEERQKLERLTAIAAQEGAIANTRPTTTQPLVQPTQPVSTPAYATSQGSNTPTFSSTPSSNSTIAGLAPAKEGSGSIPRAPQVVGSVNGALKAPLVLSSLTAKPLSTGVTIQAQPNTPYIQTVSIDGTPLPGTIVFIKDQKGTVVQAHKSNEKGYIVPQRQLTQGEYIVEFQNDKYNFPQVKYIADNQAIQPVSIKALN